MQDQKTITLLEQVQLKQNEMSQHLDRSRPFLANMALIDIERLLIQIEMHCERTQKRSRPRPYQGFNRDLK